jgi:hypothetical protein
MRFALTARDVLRELRGPPLFSALNVTAGNAAPDYPVSGGCVNPYLVPRETCSDH